MLYMIIGSIVLIASGIAFFYFAEQGYSGWHTALGCTGVIAGIAGVIGVCVTAPLAFDWYAADVKAQLINREYGTTYTQAEVFYASSVIDLVRELDRKRVEVNGDVLRERDEQRDQREQ